MSKFDTHGGYFAPKDYMRVNEGGSHEENPNGGVQVGVDSEGNPNLLEEGEPVYKDYVYSDNIEAEEQFLVDNNLPGKYAGKLYSKIADDLFSEAEERPLDQISRNGLEVLLGRLADAQEGQKQAKEQADLENELANLSPEELEQLETMLFQEQQPIKEDMVAPEEPVVPQGEPGMEMPVMACGGLMNKYPDGGSLNPAYVTARGKRINVNAPRFVTGPTLSPVELNPRPISWDWTSSCRDNIAPAYVTDRGPQKYTFPGFVSLPHSLTPGIVRNSSLGSGLGLIDNKNEVLDAAYVSDVAPTQYSFDYRVEYPSQERLKTRTFNSNKSVSTTGNPADKKVGEAASASAFPTWPRYAGAIGAGLLGLYDAFQSPDKYMQQRLNPQLPEGRIHLQNQVYNPIDQNMIANAQIAQGNATNRALRNSGLGAGAAASILAADNNLTGNLGTGFIQAWDANNQRKNAVIAANNQAEAQRAQFDYTVDAARKQILNDAAYRNAYNDLMLQRLNYGAEGDKYTAISNQIANGLQALSGIGQENFAMNQINSNPAYLGYRLGPNGWMFYNPNTKKWEDANKDKNR